MAKVVWLKQAIEQIDAAAAYIELFDPAAARRIAEQLIASGESLAKFPHRGRPSFNCARELVTVRPYILRYEMPDAETVLILSIRHAARLTPED